MLISLLYWCRIGMTSFVSFLFQLPACQRTWCWVQTTRPPSVSAGQQATEQPPTLWVLWPMMAHTTAPPLAAAATSRASAVAPIMKLASQHPVLPAWVYPATPRTWKQVHKRKRDLTFLPGLHHLSSDSHVVSGRALLPSDSDGGPGDSGDHQRLVVSGQRRPLIHHVAHVDSRPRPLPHAGQPLPHGMHHLWHQLHRQHGGVQPQWAELQLHLPRLLI